jgi:glycosyltransferase involved in cell wall biosynthesis
MMNILILTQYYPPETGASQNRLSNLAQRFMQLGHTVTILTALPNYPKGEIFEAYKGHLVVEERIGNIKVIRTWIYTTNNKSFIQRLLNYFSFTLSSLLIGVWKIKSQDFVVFESPPLFLGLSALIISRLNRAKLVFNVSDLWPESAVVMGLLQNKALISLSIWLEEFLYRRSHLITGQTQGIVDNIQSRFPDKNVSLIMNGVNVEDFMTEAQSDHRKKVRKEFEFEEMFVIGYAGLHGLAQGLQIILQAAQLLATYNNFLFVLFGDGPEKAKLIRLTDQIQLNNVRFYPSQPASRMPELISSFDIAVIPLRRLNLFKGALPSKMFEAMAAAIPCVVSIDGEARALVIKAKSGIFVEPENPEAMANAIMQLFQDPVHRRLLGENGRQFVIEHHNRHRIAEKFERLLLELYSTEGKNI